MIQITFHYIVMKLTCLSLPPPLFLKNIHIRTVHTVPYHVCAHYHNAIYIVYTCIYICLFVRRRAGQKPDMCLDFSLSCFQCLILYLVFSVQFCILFSVLNYACISLLPVHVLTFFRKDAFLQIFVDNTYNMSE